MSLPSTFEIFISLYLSIFLHSSHQQHDKPKPWDHEGIDHWTIPKFEKVRKRKEEREMKERDICF